MITKIAVYGTLKGMHGANTMLANATPLGCGTTVPTYRMTSVGFPKITPDCDGHRVRVEVYDGPDFKVLDRYEGVPVLYERRVIPIELDNGEVIDAFIYEAKNCNGTPVQPIDNILDW